MQVKKSVYRELVRTDKHGNKTYRTNCCRKCRGTGKLVCCAMDAGRCWRCMGTGVEAEYRTVDYTPEQQRLRSAKSDAKKRGTVEQQYRAHGFGDDGIAYIPQGNTFEVKEQIKELGGYWDFPRSRWIMPVRPNFCEVEEVRAADVSTVEHINEQGFEYDIVVWNFSDNSEGRTI